MKYANKSYGNKIREAYAMFNKVHSLSSEHHPKISLVPIFTFCLPNHKWVAHITKQFLPEITPKGRKKRNFNQQKTTKPFQSPVPAKCGSVARSTKVSFNLFRVQWTNFTMMRYSGTYIFFADWILQDVQNAKCLSGLCKIVCKIQILEKFRLELGKKISILWNILQTPDTGNLDFVKYFAEFRFLKSQQCNLQVVVLCLHFVQLVGNQQWCTAQQNWCLYGNPGMGI